MAKNLTVGSPLRLIVVFTLPLLIGNLFQQAYALSDTIVVGRMLGVDALAAVGASGSLQFLLFGFAMGTSPAWPSRCRAPTVPGTCPRCAAPSPPAS